MTKRRVQGSPESREAKALSKLRLQKFPLVNRLPEELVIRWLPEELRLQVLLRMPLQDILKSTLLCKEWKASVQSKHLARLSTEDQQREACLLFYSKRKLIMKCPGLPKLAVLAEPHTPDLPWSPSLSKGLLCYVGVNRRFVVCNPVLGHYRLLKAVELARNMKLKTVKLVADVEKCSFKVYAGVSCYYETALLLERKFLVYDSELNQWNEEVIPVPEPDFARQGLTLTKEVLQGNFPLVLFAATGCEHDLHKCWLPLARVPCPCPDGGQKLLDMRLVVYEEKQKIWSTYNLPKLQTNGLLFVNGYVEKGRCILATVSMAGVAGLSRTFSVLELDHAGKEWKLVSSLVLQCCTCSSVCKVCRIYQAARELYYDIDYFRRVALHSLLVVGQIKVMVAGDTVVIHCTKWGTASLDMAKLSWTRLDKVPWTIFTPTLARLDESSASECAEPILPFVQPIE